MAIDYDSGVGPIPNNSGNFPNVVSNNVTAPGAGDGTPFVKAMIDDAWGRFQDLLNRAGLTPSGSSEAAGSSQHYAALRRCFGAPGEVVLWHGQADPATLGLRLLLLEGQGILRANYPDLDAAVYIGDGNNGDTSYPYYYHADDATGLVRNTAGIYLILADSRGKTVRAWDPTEVDDPEGASRKFPDRQANAVIYHNHDIFSSATTLYAKVMDYDLHGGGNDTLEMLAGASGDRLEARTITGGAPADSTDNRMDNMGVKMCVRY